MGPVISAASKSRIEGLIGQGLAESGARDAARRARIPVRATGYFREADDFGRHRIPMTNFTATEIFGPVLRSSEAEDLDAGHRYPVAKRLRKRCSIFTSSGAAARKFRYEAPAGNIGVNIGVAAPMAYFPFSGWKDSFLGVLHGQGRDGVEFYTDKKVVVERWPKEWSRKF